MGRRVEGFLINRHVYQSIHHMVHVTYPLRTCRMSGYHTVSLRRCQAGMPSRACGSCPCQGLPRGSTSKLSAHHRLSKISVTVPSPVCALVGADQSKESTLVSGTAVRGSDRPTTADSEDPPSWGTWATDGKYVVLPKTWSGASYF
jgi:hypothetical protein